MKIHNKGVRLNMKIVRKITGISLILSFIISMVLPSVVWAYEENGIWGAAWTLSDGVLTVRCNENPDASFSTWIGNLNHRDSPFCYRNDIISVVIEDGIERIGNIGGTSGFYIPTIYGVFKGCKSMLSVSIPQSVDTIGTNAFSDCISLSDISIPNGVTTIGSYAFDGCTSLTSIYIPASVDTIGENAFSNCTSLTNIVVDDENDSFKSIDGVLFNYDCTEIIAYPAGKKNKEYTIPDNVVTIGNDIFSNCTLLTNIVVDDENDNFKSIDGVLFNYDCTEIIAYPSGKENKEYTIPQSVTSINNAFRYCSNLKNIFVDEDNGNFKSINGVLCDYHLNTLIRYPAGRSETEYTIPNSITEIDEYAFSNTVNLQSVAIPDSVTYIDHAFYNCDSITNIILPNSLNSIGHSAFYDCDNIASIVLPDSVSRINYCAFCSCDNITNIVLPNSVKHIDCYAFRGCDKLNSITIPNKVSYIDMYAFSPNNLVIYGNINSYAEQYAIKYNINFANILDVITITFNGEIIPTDVLPIIKNGRTLVPMRAVFEKMGCDVEWDGNSQEVTVSKNSITINTVIGNYTMYVNGNPVTLDIPPEIINDRTMLPVRAISEALNCNINWNDNDRVVEITSK